MDQEPFRQDLAIINTPSDCHPSSSLMASNGTVGDESRMNLSTSGDPFFSSYENRLSPTYQSMEEAQSSQHWASYSNASHSYEPTALTESHQLSTDRYNASLELPTPLNYPLDATARPLIYGLANEYVATEPTLNCPRTFIPQYMNSSPSFGQNTQAYPPASFLRNPIDNHHYMPYPNHPIPEDNLFYQPEVVGRSLSYGGFPQSNPSLESPTPSMSTITTGADQLSVADSPFLGTNNLLPAPPVAESQVEQPTEKHVNEPYAKLIWRALRSKPSHRMVLKEIYRWFELHTEKAINPRVKGWQNSIRHNLSMNADFLKIPHAKPEDQAQKGFIWGLEEPALSQGVKSTTRYRKVPPVKKCGRGKPVNQKATGRRDSKPAKGTPAPQLKTQKSPRGAAAMRTRSSAALESAPATSITTKASSSPLPAQSNQGMLYQKPLPCFIQPAPVQQESPANQAYSHEQMLTQQQQQEHAKSAHLQQFTKQQQEEYAHHQQERQRRTEEYHKFQMEQEALELRILSDPVAREKFIEDALYGDTKKRFTIHDC
ncbi:MAG: hypothetical protein M1829_003438 [Trizodia sp. TS-e1964]|nr:MAG: hypothetical protein M1829_003438 [Trizodia sp. TS-e1964]